MHFKALTWIRLSKLKGPALPKERCTKVDKVPPEKMDLRKTFSTIEAHPHHPQDTELFWKNPQ